MKKVFTLTDQEVKEFMKRPLLKALTGISLQMDNYHCDESELTLSADNCTFVITATKDQVLSNRKVKVY